MADSFKKWSKVRTHSLTTVQYNDLNGIVTGPSVVKNDILRIPVRVQLSNGDNKDMLLQPKNLTLETYVDASSSTVEENNKDVASTELRQCRCMFCGDSLLLESEDAAIAHMETCPALQEQLDDKDNQFTLPTSMK